MKKLIKVNLDIIVVLSLIKYAVLFHLLQGFWILSNFGTRGPVLERDFSHATRLEHWNPQRGSFS